MRGILVSLILLITLLLAAFLLWRRQTRRVAHIPAHLESYWDGLKERRRSIRFQQRLPVICSVIQKPGSVHKIFSKDISGEGIRLQVSEILPEGSQLDLRIEIPNSNIPVAVKGEVVWVAKSQQQSEKPERLFDTGIKFTKVGQKEKERLKDFLHSLRREGSAKTKEG